MEIELAKFQGEVLNVGLTKDRKRVLVLIVEAKKEGTAVRLTFEFVGAAKTTERIISAVEARDKKWHVGNYIQIYMEDSEYRKLFRQQQEMKPKQEEVWVDTSECQLE